MLKSDAVALCQENNFNSGFFEGSDSSKVIDAYELKVIFSEKKNLNFITIISTIDELKLNTAIFCFNDEQVRLEHILERISFISDAANTERPSLITNSLFIGGALAARSVYTLQHLGITHILCLCSNEIGQSDSQFYELFEYKNFSVRLDVSLFF